MCASFQLSELIMVELFSHNNWQISQLLLYNFFIHNAFKNNVLTAHNVKSVRIALNIERNASFNLAV